MLAAFCTNHADYLTYYLRFYNYQSLSSMTEAGFNLIMKLFHIMSADFQLFLCIAYAFVICTVCWFIKNNTSKSALVLAIYSIFSYCIDVVQLRNTISFCICLIGLNSLLKSVNKINKKTAIFYCVCVILASFIHFSAILFIVVLLPYYFNIRKCIFITIVSSIIFAVFGNSYIIN